MPDNATTADGAAGNESQRAHADIVSADADTAAGSDKGVADAMREAQATQEQRASDMLDARADTTPDATYVRGVEGANVNVAAPKDAPVISTYEAAQEAGYFGVAPGYANTEKLSVAAVTERDRKLGLPGTRGLTNAVVNGTPDTPNEAKSRKGRPA